MPAQPTTRLLLTVRRYRISRRKKRHTIGRRAQDIRRSMSRGNGIYRTGTSPTIGGVTDSDLTRVPFDARRRSLRRPTPLTLLAAGKAASQAARAQLVAVRRSGIRHPMTPRRVNAPAPRENQNTSDTHKARNASSHSVSPGNPGNTRCSIRPRPWSR